MLIEILKGIETICFCYIALSILYLFIFALASLKKQKKKQEETNVFYHHFVILLPAYKEDKVIEDSILSLLRQDYPKECYNIVVISDQMKEETNQQLLSLPITLLKVNFKNSSKAKALNFAVKQLNNKNYDTVVILDADNTVEPDYLSQLNQIRNAGSKAIQTHRKAKNLNTEIAILDAVSEEINNSIFRAGHAALGLSSALIGSGMAFDYPWFSKNIPQVNTVGEDKEIEALLLKQNIHIDYLSQAYVYDEKVQKEESFKHQRRRWLAAQFHSLCKMGKYFPQALKTGNINYCDKFIQMVMLPRVINFGLIFLFGILTTIFYPPISIKWWVTFFILILTLRISIPSYLINRKFYKACKKVPVLIIIMTFNLFRIKGANRKFIHTQHGED